jgi:hypothetical protein
MERGGGFGEEHNLQWEIALSFAKQRYVKSKSSMDLDDPEIKEYVQHHINAPASAKKDKKFDATDRICLDLAHRYNIAIKIKLEHWSVGGYSRKCRGAAETEEAAEQTRWGGQGERTFAGAGGRGGVSSNNKDIISRMLSDRYHAKEQRN